MKLKLEYMSMEELSRLMHNEGEDKTLREEACRQLCKRENQLFHKHRVINNSSAVTPHHYGF